MLKRVLIFLLVLILGLNPVFATQIEVTAHVYDKYTIYNYILKFDGNEEIDNLRIKKPTDANLLYIVDQRGPVDYEILDNYFIFKSQNISENIFLLKYKTDQVSRSIYETEAFTTYLDFNFFVDELDFKLIFKDNFGEIIDVFPRNYDMATDKISWNIHNVSTESVFIVSFNEPIAIVSIPEQTSDFMFYVIIFSGLFLMMFFISIGWYLYFKYSNKSITPKIEVESADNQESVKNNIKVEEIGDKVQNSNEIMDESIEIDKTSIKEDNFNKIINMHLTENEKEVVKIIKEKEGIIQNDILSYLPRLSKSNLSKIIAKLNARRILNRIKVGKVNKIHLGDKLKGDGENRRIGELKEKD